MSTVARANTVLAKKQKLENEALTAREGGYLEQARSLERKAEAMQAFAEDLMSELGMDEDDRAAVE